MHFYTNNSSIIIGDIRNMEEYNVACTATNFLEENVVLKFAVTHHGVGIVPDHIHISTPSDMAINIAKAILLSKGIIELP